MKRMILAALAGTMLGATPASAAIQWADLTGSSAGTVTGTVAGIGVTYLGDVNFAQTSGGTDYWNPFPSPDRPTGTDIISTNFGGLKTITFSQAVNDVFIALNSWNTVNATFDHAYTVVAQGCGFWGCGSDSGTSPNLIGNGELHGILKFAGPITSLSYVDTAENWHGIQIGIGSVAAVPEPASWAMMLAGFGLVGGAMRSRRNRTGLAIA